MATTSASGLHPEWGWLKRLMREYHTIIYNQTNIVVGIFGKWHRDIRLGLEMVACEALLDWFDLKVLSCQTAHLSQT